jgi:DNA-directed RNA polymerase specialized sigma24 family protein
VQKAESPEDVENALSTDEVKQALGALAPVEKAKLFKAAEFFCEINGFNNPDDLLQEALTRAYEGRRKCPPGLPMVPFLWGAMRSIANAAAKSERRSRIDPFAEPEDAEDDEQLNEHAVERVDPERIAAARQALERVNELFKDDVEVLVVIDAMASGLKGEALRQSLGLTKTEHETIRKRMMRQSKPLAQDWREK